MLRAVSSEPPETILQEALRSDPVEALTRRLVTGEELAWRELHAAYAPRLWRYLVVVSQGDEDAAAEALQRTFVKAARYMKPWTTEAELWGWLTLLARQAASDDRRRRGRWHQLLQHLQFVATAPALPPASGEDSRPAALEEAWEALSSDDRALLGRKYQEGKSVRDLAEAGGVPEKTIESRLTRARARLRKHLTHWLQP